MMDIRTNDRIAALREFYVRKGRMPSFSEMGKLFGLQSKNAVSKVVDRFRRMGLVDKDQTGRLVPRPLLSQARVLGSVEAGFPSPAEEELADTLSLDDFLIQNREATFLLKVSGDSMLEAGILPGDMVIVEKGRLPGNGDIIIAEVDGEWTLKYFRKEGEEVTLVAANSRYGNIRPRNELKVAGVVTAVVRKY